MRTVSIIAQVPGGDPAALFDRVAQFELYGELVDLVKSVDVDRVSDTRIDVEWSVLFRKGLLTWSETDLLDRENLIITFAQTDGDFELMDGVYQFVPTDDGAEIRISSRFDFGVESMESIVEPVAERVLRESFGRILIGLVGDHVVITEPSGTEAVVAPVPLDPAAPAVAAVPGATVEPVGATTAREVHG